MKKPKKPKIAPENIKSAGQILDAALTVSEYCVKHGVIGIPALIGGIIMVAEKADIPLNLIKLSFQAAIKTIDEIEIARSQKDETAH